MKLFDKIKKTLESYDFSEYNSKAILNDVGQELKTMFRNIKDDFNKYLEECRKEESEPGKEQLVEQEDYDALCDAEKKYIENRLKFTPVRMTPLEYMRVRQFKDYHCDECQYIWDGKPVKNKVPVTFSYIVTENGIGTGITVRCENCKKTLDVTDYANW